MAPVATSVCVRVCWGDSWMHVDVFLWCFLDNFSCLVCQLLEKETEIRLIPVSKVLCGHVTNGELGENNLCTALDDLFKFVVEDVPLSINHLLILLRRERGRGRKR